MIKNGRGEMGFMESMVSMMAVVIVIGLYLAFVTTSAITSYSPLEELDPESLVLDSQDGPAVSSSYAYMFLMNKGLKGMEVSISVPWFSEAKEWCFGDISDTGFSRSFLLLMGSDNGRTLPTIVEVRASV